MSLKVSILSPERRLLEGSEAEEVTLITSEGMIQILPGHAAMVGTLETGAFSYRTALNEIVHGFISTGFFEVENDNLRIMAETIELKPEVDLERARRAQAKAEENLKQADLDDATFQKFRAKLDRAIVRQQLHQ